MPRIGECDGVLGGSRGSSGRAHSAIDLEVAPFEYRQLASSCWDYTPGARGALHPMDSSPADPPRPGSRKPRPAWLFRQASAIPFWVVAGELQVVLVTSRRQRKWIVPKGVVDVGLTLEQAALQEAHEEAGVIGGIEGAAVGRYEYAKWGGTCTVEVFVMRVTQLLDVWAESRWRQRVLVPWNEASGMVVPELVPMLEAGVRRLRGD